METEEVVFDRKHLAILRYLNKNRSSCYVYYIDGDHGLWERVKAVKRHELIGKICDLQDPYLELVVGVRMGEEYNHPVKITNLGSRIMDELKDPKEYTDQESCLDLTKKLGLYGFVEVSD